LTKRVIGELSSLLPCLRHCHRCSPAAVTSWHFSARLRGQLEDKKSCFDLSLGLEGHWLWPHRLGLRL